MLPFWTPLALLDGSCLPSLIIFILGCKLSPLEMRECQRSSAFFHKFFSIDLLLTKTISTGRQGIYYLHANHKQEITIGTNAVARFCLPNLSTWSGLSLDKELPFASSCNVFNAINEKNRTNEHVSQIFSYKPNRYV